MVKKLTKEIIVKRSKELYGDKFNYDLFLNNNFKYTGNKQKIPVYCKECKKEFYATVADFLKGHNCPYCKKKIISKIWKKAQIRIAKLFERITNKKDAYIHYVSNELLSYFDTIFMEDLNVQGMLRNHHLAKAIQEVGFYKFKETLVNKALVNGKQIVFVDRFYPSSKTCSVCGYKKRDLRLSDREWVCPKCGTKHDRDINAAMNILLEGQRMFTAG